VVSYENPKQAEGINVSDEHPVRELFILLSAVIVGVLMLVFLLSSIASWLSPYVSFSAEQQLAQAIGIERMLGIDLTMNADTDELSSQRNALLVKLGSELVGLANFDDSMSVSIHYSEDDTVNAFATLGGHIVLFKGLVERLPNENSLAMVLAHEIAHVKLRHPIVATSRGITVSLALSSIFGITDNAFVQQIVEWIGYNSTLSFSRDQERQADALAADLLVAHYGHLEGAEGLFIAMAMAETEKVFALDRIEFLTTHPGLNERVEVLRQRMVQMGGSGEPKPLPWGG